jgi:DNA-directed RNA polymerase subunit RPC12/RpoP
VNQAPFTAQQLQAQAQAPEAPRLPCRGCGAPLAVDPTAPSARCPACAATTPIPDDLRLRAIAYARTLETERRRMAGARSSIQFEKIGLYFGPPGALLIGGHIVASMFLDREAMEYEPSIFVGGLVLLGLAFFAYIAVTVRREIKNANAPPPPVVVEAFVGSVGSLCSSCGGKVQFTIEQPSARCPFCSAAVYPTQADQAALLAIAAERADLEVARATRATARSLALSFDGGAMAAVTSWTRWLSFLLAPGIFLVIGCSLLFQNGLPDFERLDMIATIGAGIAGFGLLLLALFALVFFLVRAFSRPVAIRRTLVQVSGTLGGTLAGGLRPAYDWLDAHWAADVTGDVFSAANSDGGARIVRSSLSFSYSGRPAYLVVAHAPHMKRVDLFFSAHRRRAPEYGQSIPAAHEIRSAGYGVIVSNGGVQLTHPDSDPRAFQPATVTWLLQRAAAVAAA